MARYYSRPYSSMNFQEATSFVDKRPPMYYFPRAMTPACKHCCKHCEQVTHVTPTAAFVEMPSPSPRCAHCHEAPPHPEKNIVITTVLPEKALNNKHGVTLHFETARKHQEPDAANHHQYFGNHHRHQIPETTYFNNGYQPDSARSSFMEPPPLSFFPQPHRHNYSGEFIQPSTKFVDSDNEKSERGEQQRPGMKEFMEQYRNRMVATSGNAVFRSRSQQQIDYRTGRQPLPSSDVALRNCRRWYH